MQELLIQVNTANEKFNFINNLNFNFLTHIKNFSKPSNVQSEIKFQDETTLVIKGFGYEAKAKPRFVIDENKSFAVEYAFNVINNDKNEKTEVFRFYLMNDGNVVKSFMFNKSIDNNICDFNNDHISNYICCGVLDGIIKSSLFKPLNVIE